MIDLKEPERPRSRLAGLALGLAWFGALVALLAIVVLRTEAAEPLTGFAAFASGLCIAATAALLGVAACVVVWRTGARGGVRSMLAIAIAAATLAGPAYVAARGLGKPAINDVSTDLADPPRFDRGAPRRLGDGPLPDAITPEQAERQKAAYPDIGPLRLSLPPNEAAALALGLVQDRDWLVVGRTSFPRGGPPTGRVQAVARTAILGFKDDVVIRVRPDETGSRVDMRSASRIGRSDLGANADRIRSFLADLAAAANAP